MENQLQPLIAVVGPTASGKTGAAIALSRFFSAEVVSADSMQVYRSMDIGTAKPSAAELQAVPHHMVSVVSQNEEMSVSKYADMAVACCNDCLARGRLPMLVGGTGLYVDAVLNEKEYAPEDTDSGYRREFASFLAQNGPEALHALLRQQDPEAAERIHPNNTVRVIRALEIIQITGMTTGEYYATQKKPKPRFRAKVFFLEPTPRAYLYQRIDERVDEMIAQGLVDEVRRLLPMGFSETSLQGIGYKEIIAYLNGTDSLPEAVQKLKQNTRNYAKRQLTWFRHCENVIHLPYANVTEYQNNIKTMQQEIMLLTEEMYLCKNR